MSGNDDFDIQKQAEDLINWLVQGVIGGFGGFLPSAEKNAKDHLKGCNGDREAAVESVIGWATAYASGSGFVTGLGGIALLPVALPAGLLMSYGLAAQTIATIAVLRGYDIHSDQVQKSVLLCLVGDGAKEILKASGVQVGNKVTQQLIAKIPGKVLIEINKRIGFRLITKAGEKGIINLMKLVPLAGGVVGGAFDGFFVNGCGQSAKSFFPAINLLYRN